ncbi:MAG: dipeptide epimerase [Bacteroidales bacterium]|nr:dipeptide epimerase [Bacteroidales bacterium]MCD8394443.1 dipeptide epimerase [Bacteroidales bacterium]
MSTRRQFLKTTALAAMGAAIGLNAKGEGGIVTGRGASVPKDVNQNSTPLGSGRMSLTYFPYELKLRHVFTVASNSRTTTPDVQCELHYDGVTGYGEASMPPYLAAELGTVDSVCSFLQKVADGIGQFSSPFEMEDILAWIDSLDEANSAGKAAVDIALHDLVGKLLGAPWHRIWGLDAQKAPSTTYTITINTREVTMAHAQECASLYNILKVKLGRDNDREMIETIREVTDLPIAVDVNQGWRDREHALEMINWLAERNIVMVEQPMPKTQLDDIAWVAERSPLPIFADESVQRLGDIPRLKGIFTGINIKLMKCTGMREAWKMLTLTKALGMKVMIGCMTETSCGISAAAQLSPAVDFADLDGNIDILNDRFTGVKVVDGRLVIPDGPGHGAQLL